MRLAAGAVSTTLTRFVLGGATAMSGHLMATVTLLGAGCSAVLLTTYAIAASSQLATAPYWWTAACQVKPCKGHTGRN